MKLRISATRLQVKLNSLVLKSNFVNERIVRMIAVHIVIPMASNNVWSAYIVVVHGLNRHIFKMVMMGKMSKHVGTLWSPSSSPQQFKILKINPNIKKEPNIKIMKCWQKNCFDPPTNSINIRKPIDNNNCIWNTNKISHQFELPIICI